MPELLIGAGSNHAKQIKFGGRSEWSDLTTIDFNGDHNPDVIHDLERIPLPFDDDTFDELHAYHVLEHIGRQGDWRFFFAQFSDFWRILKPGGAICAVCPSWNGKWTWGDPGHTRLISRESLIFLCQPEYAQVGQSPMTDYRFVYKADFDLIWKQEDDEAFAFVIKAVKPSRCVIRANV